MFVLSTLMDTVARPLQRQFRRRFSERVDRRLGIVTTAENVIRMTGIEDPLEAWSTGPLSWIACWRILGRLPRPQPGDVFMDIGCGAGRMVCAAARASYSSVVGVEIRPDIAAVAAANVERLRHPHGACEIIEADATSLDIRDDVTVVFLYNPFQGSVLDAVISRITESVARAPRKLILVYANPVEHQRISAAFDLMPTERIHFGWRPSKAWKRTKAVQFYEVGGDAFAGVPGKSGGDDVAMSARTGQDRYPTRSFG